MRRIAVPLCALMLGFGCTGDGPDFGGNGTILDPDDSGTDDTGPVDEIDDMPTAVKLTEEWSDMVPYVDPKDPENYYLMLVLNKDANAVQIWDMLTQAATGKEVNVAGDGKRLAYDPDSNTALVAHGTDASWVDHVDLNSMKTTQIPVVFDDKDEDKDDDTRYAVDVVFGDDGTGYALVEAEFGGSGFDILELDLVKGAATALWRTESGAPTGVGKPLGYHEGVFFMESTSWVPSSKKKGYLELAYEYGGGNYPNRYQIAPDGAAILSRSSGKVQELDAGANDTVLNSYEPIDSDIRDFAYTWAGDRVVVAVSPYDTFDVHVFDRTSTTLNKNADLGPQNGKGTIAWEQEFMAIARNDLHAYVYAYDDYASKPNGWILRMRITQ